MDADVCVALHETGTGAELFDLDIASGKLLLRGRVERVNTTWGFALSRSGDRIAVRDQDRPAMVVLSRDGVRVRTIELEPDAFPQFASWGRNDSLVLSTVSVIESPASQIRRAWPDGRMETLYATKNWVSNVVVSPEGNEFAFGEVPTHGDVWLAKLPELPRAL
jgi:hypothetical protein